MRTSHQTNNRCLATCGVAMYRDMPSSAFHMSGTGRAVSVPVNARLGFNAVLLTYRIDVFPQPSEWLFVKRRLTFRHARPEVDDPLVGGPRRVTSIPLIHGFSTSAFVRPCGLAGRRSHSRAKSPVTLNGPPFSSPLKDALGVLRQTPSVGEVDANAPRRAVRSACRSRRRPRRQAAVAARLDLRSGRSRPATRGQPHRRSPTARRSMPRRSGLIGRRLQCARRFAPARMELVATSPTRFALPDAICWPAFSNQ